MTNAKTQDQFQPGDARLPGDVRSAAPGLQRAASPAGPAGVLPPGEARRALVPAVRDLSFLASGSPGAGSARRARFMRGVQASAGNAAIGRLARGASLQRSLVQRQPAPANPPSPTATAAAPAPGLSPGLTDTIVSASLHETLARFQNIPIDVTGIVALPDIIGPFEEAPIAPQPGKPRGALKTVTVTVHAQYFINYEAARQHFADARQHQRFQAIVAGVNKGGHLAVLHGEGVTRGSGKAVEYGKASPDDIKLFVEEAIKQDVIRQYAVSRRKLGRKQQLVDLPAEVLQKLIQDWMRETGVGVDCGGLVQQAAIKAREDERAIISLRNALAALAGLPPVPLPPEIGSVELLAGQFNRGPKVTSAADLRPGDSWILFGAAHVRIVTDVRAVTLPDGKATVEFKTAESAGDTTHSVPGPVANTWRTAGETAIYPVVQVVEEPPAPAPKPGAKPPKPKRPPTIAGPKRGTSDGFYHLPR